MVTVTKLSTLMCLGLALGMTQAIAQGTRGPDIKGAAISNVGTNAVLIKDIIQIRGTCLSNIVDELINSVSAGKVRVLSFNDISSGMANTPPFEDSVYTTSTNAGCNFEVRGNRVFGGRGFGKQIWIKADLSKCPSAFPGIEMRKVKLVHVGKQSDWKYPEGATVASFSYEYSESHKLDAFGNIVSSTSYASDPKVIGGTEGELEFQGYSDASAGGPEVTGDPVFKYPALKYRECLQTGLSHLAKHNL